jgi:drug/metabolite transporter (DMT)-like permease
VSTNTEVSLITPSHASARLQLLAAAILFSTGGAAIKAVSLTPWQVASFRSGVAALAVLLFLPAARRGWNRRSLLVACGYAGCLVTFALANRMTTAANAIYLQATAPLYLLLLGPWLLREPVKRSDLGFLAAIAGGMVLFFVAEQPPSRTAPAPLAGNILGVISGITWAFVIAGLRWIESGASGKQSGMATVAAGNALAFLIALPMALPVTQSLTVDWIVVAYLGVFQVGLAYVFVTHGVRGVPAFEASLLLMAEPALNPVWAYLLHAERPGPFAIAGGLLILGATLLRAIRRA